MKSLSAELIAIIATGVALAGLLLAGQHRLEDRLLAGEHRLENRLLAGQHRLEDRPLAGEHRLENRLLAGQHQLESRLLAVEREQARINALLEDAGFTVRPQDSKALPE